jgi:hypothetical protein
MTFSSKKAMEAHIKTHSGSVPNSEAAQQLHPLTLVPPLSCELISIDPALLMAIELRDGDRL